MQDIGGELPGGTTDRLGKNLFIDGKLLWRQQIKARARVRHDITHTRHRKVQLAFGKTDKTTMVQVNSWNPGNPRAGHPSNEKILVTGRRRLTNDILQVKAAAGTLRMLADEMHYFHNRRNELPSSNGRSKLFLFLWRIAQLKISSLHLPCRKGASHGNVLESVDVTPPIFNHYDLILQTGISY